jgi:hypothetical protein
MLFGFALGRLRASALASVRVGEFCAARAAMRFARLASLRICHAVMPVLSLGTPRLHPWLGAVFEVKKRSTGYVGSLNS